MNESLGLSLSSKRPYEENAGEELITYAKFCTPVESSTPETAKLPFTSK